MEKSQEKYQSTEEEIKKAEGMMTEEEKDSSALRATVHDVDVYEKELKEEHKRRREEERKEMFPAKAPDPETISAFGEIFGKGLDNEIFFGEGLKIEPGGEVIISGNWNIKGDWNENYLSKVTIEYHDWSKEFTLFLGSSLMTEDGPIEPEDLIKNLQNMLVVKSQLENLGYKAELKLSIGEIYEYFFKKEIDVNNLKKELRKLTNYITIY